MKEFNITGVCIQSMHYMVDISKKIDEIFIMVQEGQYFAINKPRQYGKTTTIYQLEQRLKEEFLIINISFEGIGDDKFKSEQNFCSTILGTFARGLSDQKDKEKLLECGNDLKSFEDLSIAITKFSNAIDRKLVLLIDEVDKASNFPLFLNFLGLLRTKYLNRNLGKDQTFHSVILAGVYDIKNLKLKIPSDGDKQYNSPWNIAADFKVDLSFSPQEIETILVDYNSTVEASHVLHLPLDQEKIFALSKEIYNYTKGYPFLVSKICKVIVEDLQNDWTINGIQKAINLILDEKNTLFDEMIKNLENNQDLYEMVRKVLLDGEYIPFNIYNPSIEHAFILGLISKENNSVKVSNRIFEICIYNYIISKNLFTYKSFSQNHSNFVQNGKLNFEHILDKFQETMKEEFKDKDSQFIEREGRLLFLCFLKPIINGRGFYFVEPETRKETRMDIVIVYGEEEHIVELKIWHGKKSEDKGIQQLLNYIDNRRSKKGYLVIFSFLKGKKYTSERIHKDNKEIYSVVV